MNVIYSNKPCNTDQMLSAYNRTILQIYVIILIIIYLFFTASVINLIYQYDNKNTIIEESLTDYDVKEVGLYVSTSSSRTIDRITDFSPASNIQEVESNNEKNGKTLEETLIELSKNNDFREVYLTSNVNVRKGPGEEFDIIFTAKTYTKIIVLSSYDIWSYVEIRGKKYFMCNKWFTDSKPTRTYTDEELYLLSHIIAGEAMNCDDIEQQLVASVVLNRISSKAYPNNMKDVVYQPKQYSCIGNGTFYREPTEDNVKNAIYILENGSILPEDVVYQSAEVQGSSIYLHTKYHYYCSL